MTTRSFAQAVLLGVLATALLAVLATSLPLAETAPPGSPSTEPPDPDEPGQPPGGPEPPGSLGSLRLPFLVFLGVVLLVAVLLAYHLLYRSPASTSPPLEPQEADPLPPDDRLSGLADTAGSVADRLSANASTTIENEVYRAWWEMTRDLAIANRQSKTPRDFETLAVQAGMDRDDVRELTRLFETVRYGGAEPTELDENRAVELLRHIESTYGSGDA